METFSVFLHLRVPLLHRLNINFGGLGKRLPLADQLDNMRGEGCMRHMQGLDVMPPQSLSECYRRSLWVARCQRCNKVSCVLVSYNPSEGSFGPNFDKDQGFQSVFVPV